jgi:hypothetical protein
MKKIAVVLLAVALGSCGAERQIQVDMLGAELIKVDTVYRYPGNEQLLVWKAANDVEYVSYAPLTQPYRVGTRMVVMVRR